MPKRKSSAEVSTTASQPQAKRTKNATTTATDDAPQPVETPSKKRGRPSKESIAANEIQAPSAKKRGRPARKSDIGANEQPSASKKRGRPAAEIALVPATEGASEGTVETPSKKRGRPAKDAAIVTSTEPSSAKKRGRPPKDASLVTASKTTSPTHRGRPAKEKSSTTPATAMTNAKAKSTPTKKTTAQPGKRGRPAKAKSEAGATPGKATTDSFPSAIGDVLEFFSERIEDQWPDLAKNLSLEFHEDAESNIIWGKFNIGIYEGFLRHKGLQMQQKMKFDYRSIESGTGEGNMGVCKIHFQGQKFTATFSNCEGGVSVEGIMDTKKSSSSEHDTSYFADGWLVIF